MKDCRVARLRALAVARPTEAARLNEEVDALLAARAAGQSLWGSELSPLFLRLVLEYLQWDPAVCGVMRAVCSTWGSILDALLPRLRPWGSATVMVGKLEWYQSVVEVNLTGCEEEDVSGVLAELQSMPLLRSLSLPSSCAQRAVDAEALCGLTALTTLRFRVEYDGNGARVEEEGESLLDLSRLTSLTALDLEGCTAVTDKQVLALSNATGLTDLNLTYSSVAAAGLRAVSSLIALTSLDLSLCGNVTAEGLRAVSSLTALTLLSLSCCTNVTSEGLLAVSRHTALTSLNLCYCPNVTSEVLRAVSGLTALSTLDLSRCENVPGEGLRAVSSLTALTTLNLAYCPNVSSEDLQALRSLTALSTLGLYECDNVTAAAKQALRTAIPNLTILDIMMRTLPPPSSCCHPTPQRTPRSTTVYSASCGWRAT
jgi:hypothetical protein